MEEQEEVGEGDENDGDRERIDEIVLDDRGEEQEIGEAIDGMALETDSHEPETTDGGVDQARIIGQHMEHEDQSHAVSDQGPGRLEDERAIGSSRWRTEETSLDDAQTDESESDLEESEAGIKCLVASTSEPSTEHELESDDKNNLKRLDWTFNVETGRYAPHCIPDGTCFLLTSNTNFSRIAHDKNNDTDREGNENHVHCIPDRSDEVYHRIYAMTNAYMAVSEFEGWNKAINPADIRPSKPALDSIVDLFYVLDATGEVPNETSSDSKFRLEVLFGDVVKMWDTYNNVQDADLLGVVRTLMRLGHDRECIDVYFEFLRRGWDNQEWIREVNHIERHIDLRLKAVEEGLEVNGEGGRNEGNENRDGNESGNFESVEAVLDAVFAIEDEDLYDQMSCVSECLKDSSESDIENESLELEDVEDEEEFWRDLARQRIGAESHWVTDLIAQDLTRDATKLESSESEPDNHHVDFGTEGQRADHDPMEDDEDPPEDVDDEDDEDEDPEDATPTQPPEEEENPYFSECQFDGYDIESILHSEYAKYIQAVLVLERAVFNWLYAPPNGPCYVKALKRFKQSLGRIAND
ncbi:hypothetical protein HK102_012472 [Quaeritorhiza haematococci]|nr:hypothetical protein HK102_012472 [Quaeritorhiza haematococci]